MNYCNPTFHTNLIYTLLSTYWTDWSIIHSTHIHSTLISLFLLFLLSVESIDCLYNHQNSISDSDSTDYWSDHNNMIQIMIWMTIPHYYLWLVSIQHMIQILLSYDISDHFCSIEWTLTYPIQYPLYPF